MKQSAICILDGMGPQAGGYLYNTLMNMAVREYGAQSNDDFPEVILHSIPVPDFISSDKNKDRALTMLKSRVKQMGGLNVSSLSIACNTAHILMDELQKASVLPLVSIIEEVVKQVKEDGLGKVGLLATPSTVKYELYQSALRRHGIATAVPAGKQTRIIERIVRDILKDKVSLSDGKKLMIIVNSLKQKGVQGIILGCTELPLIFPAKYGLPVYNCVEILARTLLQKYYKQNTI